MQQFSVDKLEAFTQSLFLRVAAGTGWLDKANALARLLVLTDAMGRRTHGVAMAALYLADIEKGGMQLTGEPTVIQDNGISAVWDGHYLPGLWLVDKAIQIAFPVRKPMASRPLRSGAATI